jgi:ABC-type transporter Mla MlaB component
VRRRDTHATVVLARGGVDLARWPLAGRGRPDLAVVDELARLQLAARHLGCSIRLRGACRELSELLELAGLTEIVTGAASLGLEVGGESERREQAGVDEIVMPDDPVA